MKGKRTYLVVLVAVCYAAGIRLGLWAHNAEIDMLLGSLAALTLRLALADQKAETAEPPPPAGSPPASTLPLIALLCYFILPAGCTTDANGKRIADIPSIARICGNAAQLGGTIYLSAHPDARPAFEKARAALAALEAAGDSDPVKFADALAGLPCDELRGGNGSLYISTAIVVWDELKHSAFAVNHPDFAQPIIRAVLAGLTSALDATEKP